MGRPQREQETEERFEARLLFAVPPPSPLWAIVTDDHGKPKGEWSSFVRKVYMLGCFADNPEGLEPMGLASGVYRLSGDGSIDCMFETAQEADLTCLHWAVDLCESATLSDGRLLKGQFAIRGAIKDFERANAPPKP